MKTLAFFSIPMVMFSALALVPANAAPRLSADRLQVLDKRGYFTPSFKETVRDLVETRQAIVKATDDTKALNAQLPQLQQQAKVAQAKTVLLQRELETYVHPDELDLADLQNKLKDSSASLTEQIQLAQAYIWAYPTSPHQSEAKQDLQELQGKLALKEKGSQDADAAKAAARAALQQRALAKNLSLAEWKDFLLDMSQEDVLKFLGHPQSAGDQFWIYRGDWTTDPVTQQKVGLMVSFNGARVNTVTEAPPLYPP